MDESLAVIDVVFSVALEFSKKALLFYSSHKVSKQKFCTDKCNACRYINRLGTSQTEFIFFTLTHSIFPVASEYNMSVRCRKHDTILIIISCMKSNDFFLQVCPICLASYPADVLPFHASTCGDR